MSLEAGTRLGPYEVLSKLGEGGMGEVYRARDTKLQRDVAIKTISGLFAGSPERIARFEREAQLLAALNHPNIGAIYGVEDAPSGRFLILELVEGESLAQRLASVRPGVLDIPTALSIAAQIVEALDAAHDRGIVHRDLKPANIMLTSEGQVKVLDFGLARAMETDPASSAMNSPTLTLGATQAGVILGTAAYMSPEQAKGRIADKRSDVWAFGCVLFEMLTGKRAFEGDDVSDTLAAILRGEPDWGALPTDLPANIAALLRQCLQKDRKARIPDISVVRYLMAEKPAAPERSHDAPPLPVRRKVMIAGATLAAGVALGAVGSWMLAGRTPPARNQPVRFAIVPEASDALSLNAIDPPLAFSPSGTHIVYTRRVGDEPAQLAVRGIDRLEPVVLPGTQGARSPFFSPDGRWIGFFTNTELKKVSITGGPPDVLCKIATPPRGGTWTSADTIVFATAGPSTGLSAVSAAGGEPRSLTTVAAEGTRPDHVFPHALPDGKTILFAIVPPGDPDSSQIALLDLETGEHRVLVRGGTQPQYAKGQLIYAAGGALRAMPFDPERRELAGEGVPVEQGVLSTGTGAAAYALSPQGHVAFVPGTSAPTSGRSLVWVDRKGREQPIAAAARAYVTVRLSPDDGRLALSSRDEDQDVWIWDLTRRTLTRLTSDAALDQNPVWMRDGRRVIFQSTRAGPSNLFVQPADGTGTVQRLTTSPRVQVPQRVTADDTQLILLELEPGGLPDIALLPLDGKSSPRALIESRFADANADVSPDGRWIVYNSSEAGENVYVRPFPHVDAERIPISPGGGSRPVWSRAGRELFYLDPNGAMMAVPVQTTPVFRVGEPVKLFDSRYYMGIPGRSFDVSRDGQRFIMIKENVAPEKPGTSPAMVVVMDWAEEVKSKLPEK